MEEDLENQEEQTLNPSTYLQDLVARAKARKAQTDVGTYGAQSLSTMVGQMGGVKTDTRPFEEMRKSAAGEVESAEGQVSAAEKAKALLEQARIAANQKMELATMNATERAKLEAEKAAQRAEENRKDRELKAAIAKMGKEAKDAALEVSKGKAEALPQKAVETITAAQDLSESLKLVDQYADEATKKGIGTGWLESKARGIGQMAGIEQDPSWVNLQAQSGRVLANYMKMMSGTAVSEAEMRRLEANFPSTAANPQELKTKLKLWAAEADRTLNNHLKAQQMAGKNVDPFIQGLREQGLNISVEPKGGMFTGKPKETLTPAPTQDTMIRVKNKKTGQTGSMPKSKFNPELFEQL